MRSGIAGASAFNNRSITRGDVSVLPDTTEAGYWQFNTLPSGAMIVTGL